MIQRTKCGLVVRKLVISLKRDSCSVLRVGGWQEEVDIRTHDMPTGENRAHVRTILRGDAGCSLC